MNGVAFCLVGIPPCPQREVKGRRDGISSSNENPRPVLGGGVDVPGAGWQGPRTLVLHKNSQGFGFTLRHFIVYPPESALHTSLKDEENGNEKGFQQGRLEPMDTIFVKNVREQGPAHQAGLCTGDRLVKVNGESVLGKTYSQVIALIQNSESVLELSIMPKDEDVLQLAYSHDAYLRGNEPFSGGAQLLPPPPPLCYPAPATPPHMGQNQLDSWSRLPSVTASPPLHSRTVAAGSSSSAGSPAHRTEEIQYGVTASAVPRGRSFSTSSSSTPPPSVHSHHLGPRRDPATMAPPPSRSERCQQALSDWYYSQVPERERQRHRSMRPRHRSFSQDRLGELADARRHTQQRQGGWPHSASQDTLLLLQQQSGPGPRGDPHWSYSDWEGGHQRSAYGRARSENLLAGRIERSGRSLEMLDYQRQAPPTTRTEASYQRQVSHFVPAQPGRHAISQHSPQHHQQMSKLHPSHTSPHHAQPQQAVPQTRGLPSGQSLDEQPVGYRSYSPSFNRKTGRLMQQAHSFRDPSYTGPHLSWAPAAKTSPPEGLPPTTATSAATSSPSSGPAKGQDLGYRPTNHERPSGEVDAQGPVQKQEVVLRQKPPTGRKSAHALRHPHYILPLDGSEPELFLADATEATPADPASSGDAGSAPPRRANGRLPPLSVEDDSLASIPFIDEPTSPGVDLRARPVPASSVVSSGGVSSAPPVPASPTFTFSFSRLFSHDCSSVKSNRRGSYMLAITTERSKSCDEGLNTFRDEGRIIPKFNKRFKSFFTDGSLDSLASAEEARSKRHSTSELGSINYSDVRREGWLHYKQIHTEKGKKVGSAMRPWRRVYSVLRSQSLCLYKDKREAVLRGAALGGSAEDEQPIGIRGCLVDIAYSETKRKNALRLTTQDFCEYLLQAEDRDDMLAWIKAIGDVSKTDSEELGFSRQALISKKLNDYRKQSPTGTKPDSSPKVPRMKPAFLLPKTEGGAPRSPKSEGKDESSPPKSPWGINIIKKAKKAGPKAFGVRLEDCQPAINNKFIPLIVEICCGLVEDMGLEYTGIYRVPGNNAVVSSLQEQLNKGTDINTAEEKWQDMNVISSLLKSFFRKLPEPLFTDDKYGDFIEANRMESASSRLKTMKKLIHDLPDHYFHTLKFLVCHLKTVADHSEKNKMEPRNLALVFGPTLVRTSEDNMTEMVTHMPDRYKIVETLIQHYIWFFSEELDKDEKTPVDTEDVQPAPNIDHLLSNIGRTAQLGEASDSTNSDSAKSKGSWGSKRDMTAKEILTLSIMSAVTRKRRKRHKARLMGSSTDDDSEHEPIKSGLSGDEGPGASDTAPKAEEEEDDDDDEKEEGDEEEAMEGEKVMPVELLTPSRPCSVEAKSVPATDLSEEEEVRPEAKRGGGWGPEDARSIVSGYSTLSTLGRSLASEGRGEEADDEQSELVSETDNESGFASRSLTQERPEKKQASPANTATPTTPRSFLYTHYKPTSPSISTTPPAESTSRAGARSTTPSTSSYSSSSTASHRLHPRPSFNSHRLIQCDTLARRKLKGGSKARSMDLLVSPAPAAGEGKPSDPVSQGSSASRPKPSSSSSQESLVPSTITLSVGRGGGGVAGGVSLMEQVRARLLGSADDLRSIGLRKPLSPETRRKRRAWRRHTVVVSPTEASMKTPGNNNNRPAPPPKPALVPPYSPGTRDSAETQATPTPARLPNTLQQYL
ncbi:rho GTPase-activating protein 23 isoform X4 [Denticeps clupeoides]|uniref:Rho GTPase-activating protein 23-like n=1 Tax=Denticeps clupeoides TaxID=299321 RepID=A0AAY4CMU9_9TELE|nr:rho GTPase-activating protein 23-like isoform X4 [Denticeps clupeoides]